MDDVSCSNPNPDAGSILVTKSTTQKRQRGRPKKVACSLPVPLFVPSTPSKSDIEALETWNTAKLLGVKSSNEGAIIVELRKSKVLLVLEEKKPVGL